MHWWLLAVSVLVGALLWTGIVYPGLSRRRGWAAGEWAGSDNWAILLWIGVVATLVSGVIAGGVLGMLIVVALAGPLTIGITELLKENSQLPAKIAGVLALPWCVAALLFRALLGA